MAQRAHAHWEVGHVACTRVFFLARYDTRSLSGALRQAVLPYVVHVPLGHKSNTTFWCRSRKGNLLYRSERTNAVRAPRAIMPMSVTFSRLYIYIYYVPGTYIICTRFPCGTCLGKWRKNELKSQLVHNSIFYPTQAYYIIVRCYELSAYCRTCRVYMPY